MDDKNSKSAMWTATERRRLRNAWRRNISLSAACTVVVLLAGSSAYADPGDAAADGGQLVEITVTAQRRVESAQKVPIFVALITPDAALNAGAVSTDMLAQLVPGMQMGHEIDSATTFIRGIGPNSNGTGEKSSVAVCLDDIYIPTGDATIFHLNATSASMYSRARKELYSAVTQPAASSRSTPRTRNRPQRRFRRRVWQLQHIYRQRLRDRQGHRGCRGQLGGLYHRPAEWLGP